VSVDILNLGYKVDTAPIKRAEQDLNKFGRANTRAAGEVNELGKRSDSTSKQLAGFKTQIAGLIATYASFASARAIISIADQYTKFTAQLKLATDSQEKFTQAYSNVVAIARSSQSEIGGLGTLYARITNATREMGLAQSDVAKISETVALSLRVSGASASESASAMLQLSQAFGSGVLRVEEFNAVNEAAPGLLRALAESIGAPVGALREMASNGELTADVLARAFKDDELLAKLREQAKEVQTVSSAITSLGNELTVAIGELDKATGASKKFADAILDVAKSISNLQNVYPQIEPYLQGGAVAAGLYLLPGLITNVSIAISSRLIPSLILLAPYVAVFSALTLAAGSAIKVLNAQSAALQNAESTAKRVANLQEQIAKAQALIESGQGSSVTVERLKTMKAQLVEAQDALEKFKVAAQAAQSQDEEQVKTQNTVIQSIKDKVKEQRKAEKQLKELQKAREKALDQQLNVLNAEANVTDQIKEQTIQIIEQTRAVGMSESQLRQLELAKIDDQIATTEQRISMISFGDANDDLIKQYKEQIAALNNLKSAKTGLYNKQAAQKIVDANKDVAKQIEDDLVNAFESAFLRGGDFASSLKRAIEAQFAKLVLRPVIQSAVSSAGSSISSVVSGSGLSGGGLPSNQDGALSSLVTGGLQGIGLNSFLNNAGTIFSGTYDVVKMLGGTVNTAATVAGSAASMANTIAPYAGSIVQLLQGDVKGAAGSAIGTAIGSLAGPLGAALGGYIGGKLFSGSSKVSARILDQNFLASNEQGLQSSYSDILSSLGGTGSASFFFGGNTGRQGQNPNFHLGVDLASGRRFTTLESRAGATGENGTFLGSEIALNQENISLFATRAVVTALQESNFSRNINELFDSIDERTASMEELTQLFSDAESLKNFNDAMREMNGPLRSLSNSSLDATLSFLRAVNGLEGFQQRMSFFYKEFTSDAEQFSDMSSMLSSELRAVGGALFSTREQFSDFFKTLGPDQFARISALLPQIDSYYDTIEQRQAESFKATLDSLERIRKAGLGIADYLRQLGIAEETLSPQKRLQAASAEFNRLLSLSKLGDVASLEKITGASDQLLNAARSFFGSNAEFKTIFDRVTTELSSLTQGQTGNVFTAQPIAFQRQDQTNQQLITEVQGLRSDIASGESINIKVVTVDGKVIMEETLSAARERSRRGELVVYAAGVK
jgi:tape measure domain-containing protein